MTPGNELDHGAAINFFAWIGQHQFLFLMTAGSVALLVINFVTLLRSRR